MDSEFSEMKANAVEEFSPKEVSPKVNINSKGTQPVTPPSIKSHSLSGNSAVEENLVKVERVCPRVNCPEKIVFCVDLTKELESPTFRSRSGDRFSPLKLMKRALGFFVQSKHRIDRRHEYSLIVIHETATWVINFTNDPEDFIIQLDDIMEDSHSINSFDLGSIFHLIETTISLPIVEHASLPPPYIIRAILLYGRSQVIPKFEDKEFIQSYQTLKRSPHFFIDAYYIHEPPSDDNYCKETFEVLCKLDEKGLSYIFEVSSNPTKLYDYMAQLLPHPLQRPLQKDADYLIEDAHANT